MESIPALKIKRNYTDMNYAGIYMLLNLYNNKFYIGSTNNISKRVYEHFYLLEKNTHYNKYLQRSYNKHSTYFIPLLIEKVDDIERLRDIEQSWIDDLVAYDNKIGYNISPSVSGTLGYKHTDETKEKMRDAKMGENHHNYGKPLPQSTRDAISRANKGKEVSEETREKIRKTLTGNKMSPESSLKKREKMLGKKMSEESIRKTAEAKKKEILQFDSDGKFIREWRSATDAAIELGFIGAGISRACAGKRKSYKGFIWKLKN